MTVTFDDPVTLRRAARLSGLLAATDEAVRSPEFPARRVAAARAAAARRTVLRWRAAAAAVVLVSTGFAVPPVRAVIVGAAERVWERVTGRVGAPAPSVHAPAAPPAPAGRPSAVTFPAPEEVFVLRIATRQAAGTLTIETTASPDASVAVSGAGAGGEFVVLPEGLRIVNDPSDTAGYLVRVPAGLSRVTVHVGREASRVFHPDAAMRVLVDLGRSGATRPLNP